MTRFKIWDILRGPTTRHFAGCVALTTLIVLGHQANIMGQGVTPAAPSDTLVVTYKVPTDTTDPTNLQKSAVFAWNQFIALTWPAEAQGPTAYPRETPYTKDGAYKYGQAGPTGQVVWETFRHKVEIFPLNIVKNPSGTPNGYNPKLPDYGYDSAPEYNYLSPIPPLAAGPTTPFNNLDESTEISINVMYAGVSPPSSPHSATSTDRNQKILFEAKANRALYVYGVETALKGGKFNYTNRGTYRSNAQANVANDLNPKPGYVTKSPATNLPTSNSNPAQLAVGTIELKAAWRKLGPRDDPARFYSAPVRYYREQGSGQAYVDSNNPKQPERWGLVALHIIHKTPNSPSFIYTTFGHVSNILDDAGNDVEEPDGTTKAKYAGAEPFDPALKITPSAGGMPQKVTLTGTGSVNTQTARLYYHNISNPVITDPSGKPYTDPVNINRRLFPIPNDIIAVNRKAQALIKGTVWANYRLVNVQARALDATRDAATIAAEKPTYYLANEVVESSATLQHFRGSLKNGAAFDKLNVALKGKTFVMGGCMGCHGAQGQTAGGDFSVLFARYDTNAMPETIDEDEKKLGIKLMKSGKYIK